MATAKITLFGMHQYNSHLFDGLTVPSGIDRDELINNILLLGGEFEVLFADADFMQFSIGVWSKKWQHTMQRWYEALQMEYNPIENYDRMEDWTDAKADTGKTKRNEIANAMDSSIATGNGNTTNFVSPFDSSTWQNHDKADTTSNGTNASSSTTSASGDITNEAISNGVHSGRTHGNIGVTTTQQMLEQEFNIARFNLMDEIAYLFLSELCIYTY